MKKKRIRILSRPVPSNRKDKKMMVIVLNPKTNRKNTIHFGQKGYRHNYSRNARKRYLARSAGIKDKQGRLTKDNPLSANYWSRIFLWNAPKRRKRSK